MKGKIIAFCLIFFLSLTSVIFAEQTVSSEQQEIVVVQTQQDMQQSIDSTAKTVTYSFSSPESTIRIQEKEYRNVVPSLGNNSAFVKTDSAGILVEADLTAMNKTTWTFGNQTVSVEDGMRVTYKNGTLNIFSNNSANFTIKDKSSLNVNTISLENNSQLSFFKETISGKNFEVDGIRVREGGVVIRKGGYILSKDSLADWKGMTLVNDKDLFLANSFEETKNHDNWIFPENTKLSGKGEGFEIVFKEDNKWAKIEPMDTFAIKAEGCSFDIYSRDTEGKIPKVDIDGKWKIVEDGKALFPENNELMIQNFDRKKYVNTRSVASQYTSEQIDSEVNSYRAMNLPEEQINELRQSLSENKIISDKSTFTTIYNKKEYISKIDKWTSPVEVSIKDLSSMKESKVLVTNFNGFSILPQGANEMSLDNTIANSIYHKTISNSLNYNYPSIDSFEKISGASLNIDLSKYTGRDPIYQPAVIRQLTDYWETLPSNIQDKVKGINLLDSQTYSFSAGGGKASYDPITQEINLKAESLSEGLISGNDKFYETVRHELTHNYQDFIGGETNTQKVLGGNEIVLLREESNALKEYQSLLYGQGLSNAEVSVKSQEYIENKPKLKELISKYGGSVNPNSLYAPSSDFSQKWLETAGGKEIYSSSLAEFVVGEKGKSIKWKTNSLQDGPRAGFITAYGSVNANEDISTTVAQVVSDPLFYKRNNLIGEKANPIYKQKLDLLKNYGFITNKEYDAVFNPEKYGLK